MVTTLLIAAVGAQAQGTGTIEGTVDVGRRRAWVYIDGEGPVEEYPEPRSVGQWGQDFDVEALVVVRGTTVDFVNHGPDIHNIYSATPGSAFDLKEFRATETRSRTFEVPGVVEMGCYIHKSMQLEVLVVPNDWWTEVDAKGRFRIAGVSEGPHTVVAWAPGVTVKYDTVVAAGGTIRVQLAARSETATPPAEPARPR